MEIPLWKSGSDKSPPSHTKLRLCFGPPCRRSTCLFGVTCVSAASSLGSSLLFSLFVDRPLRSVTPSSRLTHAMTHNLLRTVRCLFASLRWQNC